MKLTLPRHSVNLLAQALAVPGWAKTPKDVFLAGQLLAEVLPTLTPLSQPANPEALTPDERAELARLDLEWCDVPTDIEINEKQRTAIVTCLNETAKHLPITKHGHSAALLSAFGLNE